MLEGDVTRPLDFEAECEVFVLMLTLMLCGGVIRNA